MLCPKCKSKTKVIDSRLQSNQIVRRRRECPRCNYRLTTWKSPMNMDTRESLSSSLKERIDKIKKQAQEIVDRLNKN